MHRQSLLVFLIALAPLAACSTPTLNEIAQSCPAVSILAQASEVTKVRPGGQTRDDVIVSAEILPPAVACDYELGDASASVNVGLPIAVRRGPAAGDPQTLSYFVAVIDPAGNMISKRIFERDIPGGTEPVGTITENVTGTTIGLAENRRPFEYQLLVGFQLTADEYIRNQGEPIFRP
jgi:hypothetical protein